MKITFELDTNDFDLEILEGQQEAISKLLFNPKEALNILAQYDYKEKQFFTCSKLLRNLRVRVENVITKLKTLQLDVEDARLEEVIEILANQNKA